MKNFLFHCVWVVVLVGCASTPEGAPATGATPTPDSPSSDATPAVEASLDAFFTTGQARRGSGLFQDNCVSCHASSEFTGSSFERRWSRRSVWDIYEFIAYSMPDDNPGGLPEQTYADIIAYMLDMNDFPAGESELRAVMEAMQEMMLWDDPAGGGGQ